MRIRPRRGHGRRRYNIASVKPTLVRYEAPGWGVGELWLEDGRVVWSELPRPAERTRVGIGPAHPLARRLAAFFAGEPDDFADVELELDDGFYGDCARALRAVPRGEVVTYGELAALAGPAGRGARGRHVLRPQPARAVRARATASSPRAGSARSGRSGSSTSAGCWRSKHVAL